MMEDACLLPPSRRFRAAPSSLMATHLRHLGVHAVVLLLVEHDGVLQLLANLALAPLLRGAEGEREMGGGARGGERELRWHGARSRAPVARGRTLRLDLPPDMAAFIFASFDLISTLACEVRREKERAEGPTAGRSAAPVDKRECVQERSRAGRDAEEGRGRWLAAVKAAAAKVEARRQWQQGSGSGSGVTGAARARKPSTRTQMRALVLRVSSCARPCALIKGKN